MDLKTRKNRRLTKVLKSHRSYANSLTPLIALLCGSSRSSLILLLMHIIDDCHMITIVFVDSKSSLFDMFVWSYFYYLLSCFLVCRFLTYLWCLCYHWSIVRKKEDFNNCIWFSHTKYTLYRSFTQFFHILICLMRVSSPNIYINHVTNERPAIKSWKGKLWAELETLRIICDHVILEVLRD